VVAVALVGTAMRLVGDLRDHILDG
jgi:hypothetical protein